MKKLLSIAAIMATTAISAQTAGDEDAEMFNRAKVRDQKAIEEAKAGWWTKSMKTHDQRIAWWQEARFGMFIHWGVYSLPAGEWEGRKVSGYAEHLMRKEKISRADYLQLAHRFNPLLFNAAEWVKQAQDAGMKYLIITAKHHDGFAMYDSEIGDFTITQQSAFKRDPMAELAAACKKAGLKFGFYYSHAFDWEHPDAPGNDWEYNNPGGDKLLHGGSNWYDVHPELLPKAQQYVDQKAIPQINELLTKYHPDILWFDTPHKLPLSENIRILKAIRETDPNVVVNGRLVRAAGAVLGDYRNTADRPAEFFPVTGNWEAIPTTNESYGYHQFDSSHKPVAHFIRLLASATSRGGNLLMNIGPKGDGAFDTKDQNILEGIGKWMKVNSESIYGTAASALPLQNWGVITQKQQKLYLHVFNWPADKMLYLGGFKGQVSKAYLLSDASKKTLPFQQKNKQLRISLPVSAPDKTDAVIVLETNGKIEGDEGFYIAPNIALSRLLAFDAKQEGKGFKFGDGKTDKYYVEGWKKKDQALSWDITTSEKSSYKILVKYIAGKGSYLLTLGKSIFEKEISEKKGVVTDEIGTVTIQPGWHQLRISPKQTEGNELMKLLEAQLIKVTQ
ncbi:alpha-L-fucosidase [Pseudobacter ginsenosidimutans]|uniref:alpha-L-fucosidase n=1 Tax=Pseudobacter ginsenosidimutans TaxID=661488 RepID=A0A4V2F1S6_9BACT|nr:alpha-L-fucosidase [Pseudobacter ginsenosidimutans]QEC43428.1 alpha-L-fucosidase [Pseudobacter ginsenosidimutans]RZS74806.1 alpha-L-fucosidase [Pseudobacter ginsenosidimutans]